MKDKIHPHQVIDVQIRRTANVVVITTTFAEYYRAMAVVDEIAMAIKEASSPHQTMDITVTVCARDVAVSEEND